MLFVVQVKAEESIKHDECRDLALMFVQELGNGKVCKLWDGCSVISLDASKDCNGCQIIPDPPVIQDTGCI